MGRLAPFVKYRLEWKEIQEHRRQGRSLRDRASRGGGLEFSTSPSQQMSPRFKWMPGGVSTILGMSITKFYSEQQQCLLSRLPKEIRLMIWGYVAGGNAVKIVRKVNKLSHAILPTDLRRLRDAEMVTTRKSWVGPEGYEKRYKATEITSETNLLTLLQTCKQIYIEALDVLYSQNTFEFNTIEAFYRFLLFSSPAGLQSIQSLRLKWPGFSYWGLFSSGETSRPSYDFDFDQSWQEICSTVAALSNLRSLSIEGGHGIDGRFSRIERQKMVLDISLPLSSLPERVDITFAIPNLHLQPHWQDLLHEQGCGNVRLVGLDPPPGVGHIFIDSDDEMGAYF